MGRTYSYTFLSIVAIWHSFKWLIQNSKYSQSIHRQAGAGRQRRDEQAGRRSHPAGRGVRRAGTGCEDRHSPGGDDGTEGDDSRVRGGYRGAWGAGGQPGEHRGHHTRDMLGHPGGRVRIENLFFAVDFILVGLFTRAPRVFYVPPFFFRFFLSPHCFFRKPASCLKGLTLEFFFLCKEKLETHRASKLEVLFWGVHLKTSTSYQLPLKVSVEEINKCFSMPYALNLEYLNK